jgi:hypothetical protein
MHGHKDSWPLLTTGLARMEGENAMYTRASDNPLTYSSAAFRRPDDQASGTRHSSLALGESAPGSAGPI